jgi:hypothetical protein
MLVVTEERYLPTLHNTIVIHNGSYYFYIHRDVYDSLVILSDRYSLESLTAMVVPIGNEETIKWFYDNAPRPINILAPYIGLVDCEIPATIVDCCGALHTITSIIDVRNFVKQPVELRRSIRFSMSVRDEYEMAWESFINTSIPYADRYTARTAPQYAETSTGTQSRIDTKTGDIIIIEDEEGDDEFLASLNNIGAEDDTPYVEPANTGVLLDDKEDAKRAAFLLGIVGG